MNFRNQDFTSQSIETSIKKLSSNPSFGERFVGELQACAMQLWGRVANRFPHRTLLPALHRIPINSL